LPYTLGAVEAPELQRVRAVILAAESNKGGKSPRRAPGQAHAFAVFRHFDVELRLARGEEWVEMQKKDAKGEARHRTSHHLRPIGEVHDVGSLIHADDAVL
jgi:hypothetical protein